MAHTVWLESQPGLTSATGQFTMCSEHSSCAAEECLANGLGRGCLGPDTIALQGANCHPARLSAWRLELKSTARTNWLDGGFHSIPFTSIMLALGRMVMCVLSFDLRKSHQRGAAGKRVEYAREALQRHPSTQCGLRHKNSSHARSFGRCHLVSTIRSIWRLCGVSEPACSPC